jgi:hypothetical protein
MTGCGSSDGGNEVELQVINGLAGDIDRHLTVRVTTPRETERLPLIGGDVTNSNNWTKFHLEIKDGELIEIALESSGGAEQSKGTCIVRGAPALGYARAFIAVVAFFNGQYLECADGLDQ